MRMLSVTIISAAFAAAIYDVRRQVLMQKYTDRAGPEDRLFLQER